MTSDDKKKLYAALAAPFPETCIQRTDGKLTGKGYSTSGIGYQFIVNRLNEVLGVGGFRPHRTVTVKEFTRANGRTAFEAACDMTLELGTWGDDGQFIVFAESLADGGHVAASEADARKGAYTNAFKKAAAFFGVGRQAYEGTLDDDNLPGEADLASVSPQRREMSLVKQVPPQPPTVPVSQPPVGSPEPLMVTARPAPVPQNRNRLSSKQLGAVWALARKLGFDQVVFRGQVKSEFGAALEFLSREQASQLIGRLSQKASNGNGHAHHVEGAVEGQHPGQVS